LLWGGSTTKKLFNRGEEKRTGQREEDGSRVPSRRD